MRSARPITRNRARRATGCAASRLPMTDETPSGDAVAKLRIDKWLWAARFYRTRSLAAAAIDAGHVQVDGERVKTSRAVHAGERVTVRKGGLAWNVEVLDRKSTRLNSSHSQISYAVFCLKKKTNTTS